MASITLTNPYFYKAGTGGVSAIVGYESSANRVARYTMVAPSTGASYVSLSFTSVYYSNQNGQGIRFHINQSSTSHANAGPDSEYTGTLTQNGYTWTGGADILLMPGVTYYVWLFPTKSSLGYLNFGTAAGTVTTSGAVATVISGTNGTLGVSNTLTLTRYSSDLTHTIKATCGNQSMTIATGVKADTVRWTPPTSWASQNTTGTTVSAVVTCETYSGNTLIGSTKVTLNFAIPGGTGPSVDITVADTTGYFTKYGSYIKTKSKVSVTVSAVGAYGSDIKSYSVKCGALSGTSANQIFDLPTAGSIEISATVVDSRGYTATARKTITVMEYSAPVATISSRYRCDADGNEDPDGTYSKVVFSATVTSLNNKNSAEYALKYRVTGTTAWTKIAIASLSGNYAPVNVSEIFPASADCDYEVCIEITDDFGPVESSYRTVQVAYELFQVNKARRAMGFGQRAVDDNTVAFGLYVKFCAGTNLVPAYTADDNGKILTIVNGVATWTTIAEWSGGSY